MDTRTGRIYDAETVARMPEADRQYMRPMRSNPTTIQKTTGIVGRNHPCPCRSGKKFKACCLMQTVEAV
jgi:uncharacterized protein